MGDATLKGTVFDIQRFSVPCLPDIDASNMRMKATIDFSQYPDLWEGFVGAKPKDFTLDYENRTATIWW